MVSKVVALAFILLSTTSGWASSKDNPAKDCPYANKRVELNTRSASRGQVQQFMNGLGSNGMVESSAGNQPTSGKRPF
jgi:hypothetical protein